MITRAATAADLPAFMPYLVDHNRDNGVGETPLFMPQARGTPLPKHTLERFETGLALPIEDPGWVRLWLALDGNRVVGHCDLRAAGSAFAAHRTSLGMGVDRDYRRRGLGRRLMTHALDWARAEPNLSWVDLDVLGSNPRARRLYEVSGFTTLATRVDAFVIDGDSIDHVLMTLAVS